MSDVTPNPDPLLNCADAALHLGIPERMIRRMVAEHRIPFVKIGKYVRLRQSTLDEDVRDHTVAS